MSRTSCSFWKDDYVVSLINCLLAKAAELIKIKGIYNVTLTDYAAQNSICKPAAYNAVCIRYKRHNEYKIQHRRMICNDNLSVDIAVFCPIVNT